MRTREELAWAAGFFDGDGCTSVGMRPSGNLRMRVTIGQMDRRPLERFQVAIGFGRISPGRVQQWGVDGFEKVQATVAMLWPFLSEPKREQAARCLRFMHEYFATVGPRGFQPGNSLGGFRRSAATRRRMSEAALRRWKGESHA